MYSEREATYHSFLHVGVQSANDRKTAARREFTLHVLEDMSTCSSPATPCKTGTIRRKPGKTKIDEHVKAIVDQQMRVDDETTAYQLHKLLRTLGSTGAQFYVVHHLLAGPFEVVHIAS